MAIDKPHHVVIVGFGAIGGFLALLAARMRQIVHLTLIDPQSYTAANLSTQNIFRSDVGEKKVAVVGRRALTINPELRVTALPSKVEVLPLTAVRGDIIISCVDSRGARLVINEIASRWGMPLIDTGVLGFAHLARVNVYLPGAGKPCAECAMDAADYSLLEQEYPCGASADSDVPSDTAPELASLSAALGAVELQKLITGDLQHAAIGRQITFDAHTHRLLSTAFRRNPECRHDHARWEVSPLRCSLHLTVAGALAVTGSLRVAGHRFVRQAVCTRCGFRHDGLHLDRPKGRCVMCGARTIAPSFDAMYERIDNSLPQECLERTLAQVGLRVGDVVCGDEKNFELRPEMP